MDEADTHVLDLDDGSHREHAGRLPDHLDSERRRSRTGVAGHPTNIVFLTVRRLRRAAADLAPSDPEQAIYHFLSGYTAKVAGTERGSSPSRRPPSPAPASARPSCRAGRRPTPPAARADRDGPAPKVLAGQHRLDRRPLRHRRAHGHRPHPRPAERGARWRARRRGVLQGQPVRPRRAPALSRRAGRGPRCARHLGGQGGVRRAGARSGRSLPRELRPVRARGPTRRCRRPRRWPPETGGLASRPPNPHVSARGARAGPRSRRRYSEDG